jgi:hypothetical protein
MNADRSSLRRSGAKHLGFAIIALAVGLTVGLTRAWPILMSDQGDGTFSGPCLCEYEEVNGEQIAAVLSRVLPYSIVHKQFLCMEKVNVPRLDWSTRDKTLPATPSSQIKSGRDWPQCRTPKAFELFQTALLAGLTVAALAYAALMIISKRYQKSFRI